MKSRRNAVSLGQGVSHWDYGRHYDYWKYHWGLFFAFLYVVGVIAFIRNVWKTWSPDITYNWFGVLVSFLTVGLVIYLVFIVQI